MQLPSRCGIFTQLYNANRVIVFFKYYLGLNSSIFGNDPMCRPDTDWEIGKYKIDADQDCKHSSHISQLISGC